MKSKRRYIVLAAIFICLASPPAIASLTLVNRSNQAMASAIARNAQKTAKEIRSYHVRVERSSEDPITPGKKRTDRSDIWAKGHEKMRIDVEISGLEGLGVRVTRSSTIQNGHRVITLNDEDFCIYDNCPPFDYMYGEFFCPYVLPGELNALLEADLVKPLGEERIGGKNAYKIETKQVEGEDGTNLHEREVRWVEKGTSICLRKETYKGDKLAGRLEVIEYEINGEIPESIFAPDTSGSYCRENSDGGYRETDIAEAPKICGFEPITPGYVPKGYTIRSTGWRDPRAYGLPLDLPSHLAPMWYKPFYITYSNGISEISICEARKHDKSVSDMDSLTINPDISMSIIEKRLSGGCRAYYVPEVRTLYFFNLDHSIKFRIRADLPLDELARIADSLI